MAFARENSGGSFIASPETMWLHNISFSAGGCRHCSFPWRGTRQHYSHFTLRPLFTFINHIGMIRRTTKSPFILDYLPYNRYNHKLPTSPLPSNHRLSSTETDVHCHVPHKAFFSHLPMDQLERNVLHRRLDVVRAAPVSRALDAP